MKRGKPTPGPWVSLYPEVFQVDAPKARTRIASLPHSVSNEQEANARFIVQACNSHDELLEAALEAYDYLNRRNLGTPSQTVKGKLGDAIRHARGY